MTEETEQQNLNVKSVMITWDKGKATEYSPVVAFAADSNLGYPRLSIQTGIDVHNINLNYAKSYSIELG